MGGCNAKLSALLLSILFSDPLDIINLTQDLTGFRNHLLAGRGYMRQMFSAACENFDPELILEQRICLLMPGCDVNRLCAVADTFKP